MPHSPQTPQIRPTEYMLARTTILIVDDEPGPRESLKMILSPAHKVVMAETGRAALDVLRSTPVDLVTIDLQMPGMKGEELMRVVRSDHPSVEIIVITGNGTMQTAVEGLRFGICDYISKPFDVVEVSGAVSRALERKQKRAHLVDFLEGVGTVLGKDRDSGELLFELGSSKALRARLRGGLGAAREDRDDASPGSADETLEFLDVLAEALESRDGELRKHSQRVGFYADLLAEQLGIEEELREQVRIASFLHDIGKVGLSDEDRQRAQLRTRPSLAPEEEHAEMGARLVGPLGFDQAVAEAIRHHHERWDGGGLPDALEGDAIPLASRIIAVVDRFDKLTSGLEGEARSQTDAIAELQHDSGRLFDPAVVVAFARMVERGDCERETPPAPHQSHAGVAG